MNRIKRFIFQYQYSILISLSCFPKLFLIGCGALSIPDENRYIRIYDGFIILIEKSDFHYFFSTVIINAAIPGYQLLSLLPVTLQYGVEQLLGINHLHPDSLVIPQLFNWLILVLTAQLIFKLQFLFCGNKRLSFLAAFCYISLVNTNIYFRHLLPYDAGIFFDLLAIYATIKAFTKENLSRNVVFKIGLRPVG